MSTIEATITKRLKRLPQPAAEYWEGGIVRLPTWTDDGADGRPFRPFVAIWVSPRQLKLNVRMLEPGADPAAAAVDAFVEFATKSKLADCVPSRVAVSDDVTADALRAVLADVPVTIEVRAHLPEIDAAVDSLIEEAAPAAPGMRAVPGMTIDRMRAFADAASRFYDARPWKKLDALDLLRIETPHPGLAIEYATVLGAAGSNFGIGFYHASHEFDALSVGAVDDAFEEAPWLIAFGPEWEMAPDDADVWEREALPVAREDAYPFLAAMGKDGLVHRPEAGQLAWFEGVLRAIASSSEAEIDSGRWEKDVETSDGPATVVLSLPDLLAPDPDDTRGEFVEDDDAPEEPFDRAQELAFRAGEASGRRQVQLAREALSISPDCADAYLVLGDRESDPADALALYEQAVAAAQRSLPEECRDLEHPPDDTFWGDLRTRPFMRARAALAGALLSMDRYEEAREVWRDLLRLNPTDNQGIRNILLIEAIDRADVETGNELLLQFQMDESALWLYTAALHAWCARRPDARSILRRALRENRRAVRYLSGDREWPARSEPFYRPGDETEAVIIAHEIGDLWCDIPGASQWIKGEARRK